MITERLRVLYTHDGDTLTCWRTVNGAVVQARIRLASSTRRSWPSPYGISARSYFRSLLYVNEPVEARIYGTGRSMAA